MVFFDFTNLLSISGIHKVFSPIYSGIGHVLMFHRIYPENNHPISSGLTVSPEYLEKTINYFLDNNISIVSLDEAYEIVTGLKKAKRFACFTFDDGYADNYTYALPIFEKFNVPFTIYVVTNYPDHKAVLWWYYLEDLVLKQKKLSFKLKENIFHFNCHSENEKLSSFRSIRKLILESNPSNLLPNIESIFFPYGYKLFEMTEELAMNWEQVKKAANHTLVTIGSHTVSHIALSKLTTDEAKKEITDSVRILEEKTGQKINHFAYPFGSSNEAGEREFELVKNLGFKTAFTTRSGNIFKQHKNYLTTMPRIDTRESLTTQKLDFFISGLTPFIKRKGKRIITN